jgi:hypothetical protein
VGQRLVAFSLGVIKRVMALLSVTKRCTVLVITVHAVLFALYYCFGYQKSTDIGFLPYSSLFTKSRPRTRKLYHLIPVNSAAAGARFCKTLLSSVVHGYDTIILNWEIQGDGSLMQRHKVIGTFFNHITCNARDLIASV